MKKKQKKILIGLAITGGIFWLWSKRNQPNAAPPVRQPASANQATPKTKFNTSAPAIGQVYHSAL